MKDLVPLEQIGQRIQFIRGHRVMLDSDLAQVYGVSTGRLNEQVRRNIDRFPDDFMFQLSKEELAYWKSQIAISNPGARMGLRKRPFAFTEHGAIMAASVLKSKRAAQLSIFVVRAFVRLREILSTNRELAQKLADVERRLTSHDATLGEVTEQLRAVVVIIRELMKPKREPPARRVRIAGFRR